MQLDPNAFGRLLKWLDGKAEAKTEDLVLALDEQARDLDQEQLSLLRRYLNRLPDFYRSDQDRLAGLMLICALLESEGGWTTHFKPDLIDRLVAWSSGEGPLTLQQRSAFGLVTSAHAEQLRRALSDGTLGRQDLVECAYDGAALSRRLSHLPAPGPLDFYTTDLNGSPLSPPQGQPWYGEPVELTTRRGTDYRMLVSTETELDQIAVMEPSTVEWLERTLEEDSVLYDVGANIGLYSLYAQHARDGVRVVAFEPAPMNFHRLLLNYQLNGLPAETVFPFAVSKASEPITFGYSSMIPGACSHQGAHAETTLGDLPMAGAYACSLDTLLAERPSLPQPTHLKIDVDGHEAEVLAGAKGCLSQTHLRHVVLETQASMLPALQELLDKAGFDMVAPHLQFFGNAFFERR